MNTFFFGSLVVMKCEEMPSIFFPSIGFGLEPEKHWVDPFIDIKVTYFRFLVFSIIISCTNS